jgi:hypothetical protein
MKKIDPLIAGSIGLGALIICVGVFLYKKASKKKEEITSKKNQNNGFVFNHVEDEVIKN